MGLVIAQKSRTKKKKRLIPKFTVPHSKSQQGSSWTFHKPARIKCSQRSLQTSGRSAERNTAYVSTSGTARQKHIVKRLLFCSLACRESQHDAGSGAAHREVLDSAGVLQQLLEGHGPAQDSVHRAGLPARGSWKAGAAASAAPRRHVQFCSRARVQAHPFISKQTLTDSETKLRGFLQKHTFTHRHAWVTGNAGSSCLPPSDTAWICVAREKNKTHTHTHYYIPPRVICVNISMLKLYWNLQP